MAEEVAAPNSTNGTNSKPTSLDISMDQTSLVDSIGAASPLVNTAQLITCQPDTCQSSVPMSNVLTSQVPPPCTLTPITAVTSMAGESQAALLFLLNSSGLPSQAETNTSCSGPFGNAVFVPQPVTINVMAQGQNSLSRVTNSHGGSNVIEKAMDLANLGEMSGGESIHHPVANAALTLVSLGTAVGQPVQEIVIDESGRSSLSHDSNLGEVSVTVESEGSSHMVSKTQVDGCTMVIPTGTSANNDDDDSIDDKTELRAKLREVVTQTGAGEKEVVVLRAMEIPAGKSLSTLLVDQSLERKRLAELKESQKEVIEKERTHPCDQCGKKFFTKHDLKRHSLVHSEVRPYECQTCKKAFRTPNELKLHLPVHNTDTPYKCEFCGKEFRTKGCIKSHIKYHIGDKRHKCTTCGRAFVKSADLKRHIAAHNNEKKYKCDECDSMFTRRDNLKAHMLLHSRKSVVTCKMCNKEFINEVYLKRHMHIHKQAKKKPYECQWCPKTYEQLEGLRRHIRQHVGDEKFVCEHCGKKFITAIQLKRHLWLSHEQNSPYRKSVL